MDWDDYENRLKRWLWIHGDASAYTIEENAQMAAIFMPPAVAANFIQLRNHQMTLFQCLRHAFQTKHSEILRQAEQAVALNPVLVTTFGRTAYDRIKALYRTQNFASASREVEKLKELYAKFNGDPKVYFEKINAQAHLVTTLGPAYVQPAVNLVNGIMGGIMAFGMRENATQPEKTWFQWAVDLQARTPAALLTVVLLETEANAYYDVYCNVKNEYERLSGKKADLGAFVAWDDQRGRKRD